MVAGVEPVATKFAAVVRAEAESVTPNSEALDCTWVCAAAGVVALFEPVVVVVVLVVVVVPVG